uniref:EGF-like domain-containing protein n=1 Tax=Alexandrium monilatum TaxID=311494 RepID=A0A7S4QZV7_9DINO
MVAQMQPLVVIVISALLQPAAAWGRCSAGPVGTCAVLPCYWHHGPTRCVGNECMCMDGYCEMGSAIKRCRAQVGTCNVLPCNWHHGGVAAVECINGACLCHTGYHNDGSNVCARGWWPPTMLAAMNGTQRLAALPYNEPNDEDLTQKYVNTLADHAPLMLGAFLVLSLAFVVLTKARRAPALTSVVEESLYKPLADADKDATQASA